MTPVTPSDGVQRRGQLAGGLQEIAVEHPVFALEADEDEVVVGAERFPELEVERGLGLALGEEGLEVVVESDLAMPASRPRRQDADGDEDPAGTDRQRSAVKPVGVKGRRWAGHPGRRAKEHRAPRPVHPADTKRRPAEGRLFCGQAVGAGGITSPR